MLNPGSSSIPAGPTNRKSAVTAGRELILLAPLGHQGPLGVLIKVGSRRLNAQIGLVS